MKCAAHPEVETNLRCGKCEKPICPRCLVDTPVGARCRDCANIKSLPTHRVAFQQYLKAIGVGLGLAIAGGILWRWLWWLFPSFFLNLLIAAGIGYGTGELISLSVNRRRGRGLQAIAGLSVVLCYLLGHFQLFWGVVPWQFLFNPYDLLALAVGIFLAVFRLG